MSLLGNKKAIQRLLQLCVHNPLNDAGDTVSPPQESRLTPSLAVTTRWRQCHRHDYYMHFAFFIADFSISRQESLLRTLWPNMQISSSPRGVQPFHELRIYHTRPLRLNWGPENVHFIKTHFWDPNIDVRIFKELPGATFLCFEFSTRVPKNGPKNGQKFKKRRKMTKITFTHLGHSI